MSQNMEVDPNKIVQNLANQISQVSLENAALKAQITTLVEMYNELAQDSMEVPQPEAEVAEPAAEVIKTAQAEASS